MCIGHGRLCVCLSVRGRIPTLLHGPGCNLGNGNLINGEVVRPLVVHCWADLQSVHGFRCYDNTHVCKLIALYTANACSAERELSASACTRSVPGLCSWKASLKYVLMMRVKYGGNITEKPNCCWSWCEDSYDCVWPASSDTEQWGGRTGEDAAGSLGARRY